MRSSALTAIAAILLAAALPQPGLAAPQDEARAASLKERLADKSLVRLYSFDEGSGPIVRNLARGGEGALLLAGFSPYGVYRGPENAIPQESETPRWTVGRSPGKNAVACGLARLQLCRSDYFADGKPFSAVAWIKAAPLKEFEWSVGDVLFCGPGWKSGWRVSVERQKWCKDGSVYFRAGDEKGSVGVGLSYFPFGAWHQLAAVWDGKELRVHVDGRSASKPFAGPLEPLRRGDGASDGLLVGGAKFSNSSPLRFSVDELALYERALSPEEINASFERGRPADGPAPSEPEALAAFEFPTESAGYFTLGKPMKLRVSVSAKAPKTAKFRVELSGPAGTMAKERALEGGEGEIAMAPERCGLGKLSLALLGEDGATLAEKAWPIAVALPQPGNGTQKFAVGVQQKGKPQGGLSKLGVRWARVVADWRWLEPSKGLYAWEGADRAFAAVEASGMKALLCLSGRPSWLPGKGPDDNYLKLLEILCSRYRDSLGAFEIENKPFGPPAFAYRGAKEDYLALSQAARKELARLRPGMPVLAYDGPGLLALQQSPDAKTPGGLGTYSAPKGRAFWNTALDCREAAAPMGSFDPADFSKELWGANAFEILGFRGARAGNGATLSSRDAAAWTVREALAAFAAGAEAVVLAEPLDEFEPELNGSDGTPSERGVALAALNSFAAQAASVAELKQEANCKFKAFQLKLKDGESVLALFSEGAEPAEFLLDEKELKGVDFLGNPLAKGVASGSAPPRFEAGPEPLYIFTTKTPRKTGGI